MTIRRGQPWGAVGPVPADTVHVHTNAALHALIQRHRSAANPLPAVALLGGDLMRAVGGTGDAGRMSGDVALLPVDIVRATIGAEQRWFAAHLVARRSWWRGEVVVVMNAQHLGRYDVAPRSHPNDGRVDIVRVSSAMSLRDRWRARSRAVQAAHVPHPDIEIRSSATAHLQFARPITVWLDGQVWTTAADLELTVEPDALLVCV
jgi:YegS C-terminal NAD kinase beta sandwich-like domain